MSKITANDFLEAGTVKVKNPNEFLQLSKEEKKQYLDKVFGLYRS